MYFSIFIQRASIIHSLKEENTEETSCPLTLFLHSEDITVESYGEKSCS